jgi:hypothetical protein
MLRSLCISAILLLGSQAGLAQSTAGKSSGYTGLCLAKTTGAEIILQDIFNNPVLRVCGFDARIIGFDLSWVTVTGKDPQNYMGPYPNKDSVLSKTALDGLKASAASGTVTRLYIDNVRGIAPDGTTRQLVSKTYKVEK